MENADEESKSASLPRRWRRAFVATSVLGGMLFSGAIILPTAVMKTGYRDSLLNSKLQSLGLQASSDSGAGSWITPIAFENIELSDDLGHVRLRVKSIRTDTSLLGLMTSGGNLGKVTVVEPELILALDDDGNLPLNVVKDSAESTPWDLQFAIQNGGFVLSVPWRKLPIVDIDDLDIEGAVHTDESGRWLTVEPIDILDHEIITEANTEQNLALIAPVLSQSTGLEGEVSVHLNATRIQLDQKPLSPFPISGHAVFHTVNARLKKDWAIQVSRLLGQATGLGGGDRNRLEIARNSTVAFEVDDIGIHHHGLAFLLPEIAANMEIESSGFVGLDETLDLALGLQLPQLTARNPLMSALSKMVRNPFQLQVKGTVSEPKLVTPPGFSMIDQLSLSAAPEQYTPEPRSVPESVINLIGRTASPNKAQVTEDLPGSISGLIRSIKKAREDAPPREKPVREKKRRRKKNRL